MKRLIFLLLFSIIFYVFVNYVFLSKSPTDLETLEKNSSEEYNPDMANVLNNAAEQEAFEKNSSALLQLVNKAKSDVLVKIFRESDNSQYMTFLLPKDGMEKVNISGGSYYIKMRYYEGRKFVYNEGGSFTVGNGDQLKVVLKEVLTDNNGWRFISGEDFNFNF